MKTTLFGPSISRDHSIARPRMAFWGMLIIAFGLLFPVSGICGGSSGGTEVWGGGKGNWSSLTNWNCYGPISSSCGAPDGSTINVKIGTWHNYGKVWLNSATSVNKLTLGDHGYGELNVEPSHSHSPTLTANTIIVGKSHHSAGILNIKHGGTVDAYKTVIGDDRHSWGEVNVEGRHSKLETRDLTVGDHGKGELNIKWGGDVKAEKTVIGDHPGSKGEVTVEGRGSKLETKDLTVGDHGRGDLTVKWGGEVKAEKTVIGDHRGSKGEVTVEGRGSKLETKDLTVGKEGKGRLAVTRGGKVEADSVKIGDKSGSKGTVIVAGRGSDLKDKGSLVVGDHGDGYLGIFDGGHVSDKVGIVGAREGSNGDVTMSGEGSAWYNRYFLGVGLNGTGKLTVENGAWVGVGSHDDPGKLLIGSNGTVDVEGDLASAIQANIVNDGGSLVVDPPIEDVSSYTQNSGTTTFEVNGTGLNDYGYIDITDSGLVDITGGTIDIDFSGFTPTPGEQFDFFAGAGYVTVGPDVTITVTGGSGSFIFNPSTGDYTFETPEPGTMTLLPIALIGLMGLMGYKKRNGLLI